MERRPDTLERTIFITKTRLKTARETYESLCRGISEDFGHVGGPPWTTSDSLSRVLIERTKVELLEDFLVHLNFIKEEERK